MATTVITVGIQHDHSGCGVPSQVPEGDGRGGQNWSAGRDHLARHSGGAAGVRAGGVEVVVRLHEEYREHQRERRRADR